jgi:hypothetical protein
MRKSKLTGVPRFGGAGLGGRKGKGRWLSIGMGIGTRDKGGRFQGVIGGIIEGSLYEKKDGIRDKGGTLNGVTPVIGGTFKGGRVRVSGSITTDLIKRWMKLNMKLDMIRIGMMVMIWDLVGVKVQIIGIVEMVTEGQKGPVAQGYGGLKRKQFHRHLSIWIRQSRKNLLTMRMMMMMLYIGRPPKP